jgi:hypothetical protein
MSFASFQTFFDISAVIVINKSSSYLNPHTTAPETLYLLPSNCGIAVCLYSKDGGGVRGFSVVTPLEERVSTETQLNNLTYSEKTALMDAIVEASFSHENDCRYFYSGMSYDPNILFGKNPSLPDGISQNRHTIFTIREQKKFLAQQKESSIEEQQEPPCPLQ